MTERGPRLYSIPIGRAFADALATAVLDQWGSDPLALAQGRIILPNNRARTAVQAAFVRHSGAGLLLPRLIALGDAELDESAGLALDPLLGDAPLPPAIDPLRRRLILSRLILTNYGKLGLPLLAPASLHLADMLARVIDQLHFEAIDPSQLDKVAAGDLSRHWDVSMKHLQLLLEQWPAELARRGMVDLAERRNLMLERLAQAWQAQPPPGFTIAAGISVSAPAVARLLRTIADLPNGMVALSGLDRSLSDAEWDALGPARPHPGGPRPLDGHPQFQFKVLLDRMGVQRAEVQDWPVGAGDRSVAGRAELASALFIPSRFTANWRSRAPMDGAAGISVAEFADDAAEARGIALLLRQALEQPGRTAALVTPDRQLAARVASCLSRWGIAADDSAGEPLGQSPPGALARLAMAAACGGGLVPLIALLGHPLVRAGDMRGEWLRAVRALDLALRGPGMPQTPAAIAQWLDEKAAVPAAAARWRALASWWHGVVPLLHPLWSLADGDAAQPPLALIDALVELIDTLGGEGVWAGPAGRQLAALFDRWRMAAPDGPDRLPATTVARQLDELLAGETVRAPFGRHPRLFIWGLLEARLQRADLMILGGLNEGGWPAAVSPDPWLAPGIRRQVGLPSIERAHGLAAHDFVTALGAPHVVVTRARRQGQDPAIASRLWLRLQAIAGPLPVAMVGDEPLTDLTARMDQQPGRPAFAERPQVAVRRDDRPDRVAVTALDMLASDPFAFYARHILRLAPLDRLGEPVDARWCGVRVHALLEQWVKDGADPAAVDAALAALARDPALDPVDGAAWLARIGPAIRWAAAAMTANQAQGRRIVAAECKGEWTAEGITLTGKADRIDRTEAGLVLVDYKSGSAPKPGDLKAGKAMQLGLLAAMIDNGAFADVPAIATVSAEYWLLRPDEAKTHAGHVHQPYSDNPRATINSFAELCDLAHDGFVSLRDRYLLGDAAFGAGDGHADYDHLARRDEWVGRSFQGPTT